MAVYESGSICSGYTNDKAQKDGVQLGHGSSLVNIAKVALPCRGCEPHCQPTTGFGSTLKNQRLVMRVCSGRRFQQRRYEILEQTH